MPNDQSSTGIVVYDLLHSPNDVHAWNAFVDRYGKKILTWCRRWGLQEADADDVAQDVLVKLAKNIRAFDRTKGSFRAWLKTITRHAWSDYLESQRRPGAGTGDPSVLAKIDSLQARDGLTETLSDAFDLELLDLAKARVQLRVDERTWEVFRLVKFEGIAPEQAARQAEMLIATAYVAVGRVKEMLREEIEKLEQPTIEEK
jgi:RNA polymerase sigma factor (sigma-70 family)